MSRGDRQEDILKAAWWYLAGPAHRPGRPRVDRLLAEHGIGCSLLGRKKYDDAERLLLSGFNGLKERAQRIPAEHKRALAEALRGLIQLSTDIGNAKDSAKWSQELKSLEP
jgi:hypothetical protein